MLILAASLLPLLAFTFLAAQTYGEEQRIAVAYANSFEAFSTLSFDWLYLLPCSFDALAALLSEDGAAEGDAGGHLRWELRMHLQADPVASLLHMAKARILIASDSSFSLVAAVLSRGLVLSRAGWKRFAPGATSGMLRPLALRDDGAFDCAAAARLWREARTEPLG